MTYGVRILAHPLVLGAAMPGGPATISGWSTVAADRGQDAVHLWDAGRTLGATYLRWYTVECLAKALVLATGRTPPTDGRRGHDIGAILDLAGLRRSDLPADLRVYYERRLVAMRYELQDSRDFGEEYRAATELATRLDVRLRRVRSNVRHGGLRRR